MRPRAPLGRRSCTVRANERAGRYRLVTLADAAGPAPAPGQFFMLAAVAGWGADGRPYLPRAFSHCRARAGELDFLVDRVGPGTERLAGLEPGEDVWLAGPFGNGFDLEVDRRPVLVGGGVGIAPLVALDQELAETEILLGFRSQDHAAAASLFAGSPVLATDDGSVGHHGYVTDLLPAGDCEVFACGPPAMLETVRALCAEHGLDCQLALETGMACGYGACFGCVHATRSGYVRVCLDGPVLRGGELAEVAG